MRYREIARQRPRVYVDMDGVLANFDAARDLPRVRSSILNSVVRDSDALVAALGDRITDPEMLRRLKANPQRVLRSFSEEDYNTVFSKLLAHSGDSIVYDFFMRLPLMPAGRSLIRYLVSKNQPFTVLSAPLGQPGTAATIQAKRKWLQQHIDPMARGTSSRAVFTKNKHRYAVSDGVPNILIDDRPKYIDPWVAAGGIGILHRDWQTTLAQLTAHLDGDTQSLTEGVNDPAIFKVIFVVGGPGSGKSWVIDKLGLRSLGFVSINSDDALQHLMRKHKLDMKMPPEEQEERELVRKRAKEITDTKMHHAIDGRLGIIIDGTGEDANKIENLRDNFSDMGYESFMVIVNTTLEISRMRNAKRARSVPEDIVERKWYGVQRNIDRFMNMFENIAMIDNNGHSVETMPQIDATHKALRKWLAKKPSGPIVDKWISDQRASSEIDEAVSRRGFLGALGAGAAGAAGINALRSRNTDGEYSDELRRIGARSADIEAQVRALAARLNALRVYEHEPQPFEARKYVDLLKRTAMQHGITSVNDLGNFLGQCGVESIEAGRKSSAENMNYTSAERIHRLFTSNFPSVIDAQPYVGNPVAIASRAYANKNGNGDEASLDGWRYRGRGFLQVTGKNNYRAGGQWAFKHGLIEDPDLWVENPTLLSSDPRHAALASVAFFHINRLKGKSGREVTARVNPAGVKSAERAAAMRKSAEQLRRERSRLANLR